MKTYIRALRPFSYTVSLFPALLTLLILKTQLQFDFSFFKLLAIIFACISAQAGANLLSDYCDFKKGVDKESKYGNPSILVTGELNSKIVLRLALLFFSFAFVIGFLFFFLLPLENRLTYLSLLLTGAILAIFYTVPPFNFKYRALGDLAVFLAFGPLMFFGASLILVSQIPLILLPYSLCLAFFVAAILHANNTRDIRNDTKFKIATMAILLKKKGSLHLYFTYLLLPYLLILIFVFSRIFPLQTLLTLISLPLAISLIKKNYQAAEKSEDDYAKEKLDEKTAGLHLLFSVLLIVGLLWKNFL